MAVAREGGEAAGIARKAVEERTGVPVITPKNAAQLNQVVTDLLEGAVSDTKEKPKDKWALHVKVFLPSYDDFLKVNFKKIYSVEVWHNVETKKMSPAKSPNISGFFATQTVIFLCAKTQM